MQNFDDSDFLVVFTGEGQDSRLIRTWDRVLAYLDYQATNREPEESYRREDAPINDNDNWIHLETGCFGDVDDTRYIYREDIGEMSHVEIIRILNPINTQWLEPEEAASR